MATKETGTIFLNPKPTETGLTYVSGNIVARFTATDQLALKVGDSDVDIIEPKRNNYGRFYVATIGDKRYFVSERENSKGKYCMCKVAPERDAADAPARAEGPKTYGSRA